MKNCYNGFLILWSIFATPYYAVEFYKHESGDKLTEQFVSLDLPVKYPHWADRDNDQLSIVSSGVVRLSGLTGTNTLDVLTYAISLPDLSKEDTGSIYYETFDLTKNSNMNFKRELSRHLGGAGVTEDQFEPVHVVLITWEETEFTPDTKSSFQMAFITNGEDTTYLIINVKQIKSDSVKVQKYPEFDTRYAYDDGSNSIRSNFLFKATKTTKTKQPATAEIAENQTNCNVPGKWVVNLSESPIEASPINTTNTNQTFTEAGNVAGTIFSSALGGVSLQGGFRFTSLSLNGFPVASDNDTLFILLTEKNSQYYALLGQLQDYYFRGSQHLFSGLRWQAGFFRHGPGSILKLHHTFSLYANISWDQTSKLYSGRVVDVYNQSVNATIPPPKILSVRSGSLILSYYVTIPDEENVCSKINLTACEVDIEEKVKSTTSSGKVKFGSLSGELDTGDTTVNEIDECSQPPGTFCDVNAYCIDTEFSYRCSCKEGYTGDGFSGNCNEIGQTKEKEKASPNTAITISAVVIAIVVTLAIIGFACRIHIKNKREEKSLYKEILVKTGLHVKDAQRRSLRKRFSFKSLKKQGSPRSFRRVEGDFDIYHQM